jgi:transposase
MRWIEGLEFNRESGNQVRDSYLKMVKGFRDEMLTITRQIKKLSQTEKYRKNVGFITSVSGIGLITGMTFLTEIDKIERFYNIDHLSSYVGLVPSTASSGDKDIVKGITPRKNKRLRKMLIESSWIAIRIDPALSLAYANYIKKMEPNKAIVKIARKLLNRMSNVLRTQKEYATCVVK